MIRNATVDDISKLVHLKTRVGKDTYFDYGTPQQFDAWVKEVCVPDYFLDLLGNSSTIIVAEYEDTFLGMASVSFYEDKALFGNLYVGLQSRGIGSLLTKHRITLVENHISLKSKFGNFAIEGKVFYQNWRAYRHMLKHGFRPVDWETHPQYSCPLVVMRQRVNNPEPYSKAWVDADALL